MIGSLCYESVVYDRIIRNSQTATYEMIVNFQITQRAKMNIVCISILRYEITFSDFGPQNNEIHYILD